MTERAMRFLPASDQSLLVELQDLDHSLDLLAALQTATPVGVQELVPAARTILIQFDRWATSAATLVRHIQGLNLTRTGQAEGQRQSREGAESIFARHRLSLYCSIMGTESVSMFRQL